MTPSNDVLDDPELYTNRELSWLEFARRVLAQAADDRHPLLERLRFLCITASIMDEFFEIRVAGLREQVEHGITTAGPDGLSPVEQLRRIAVTGKELVAEQYRLLFREVLPALAAEGIRLLQPEDWNARQRTWARRTFTSELAPVMSGIGLDPAHPFPRVLNKSLNFMVTLEGRDAFGRSSGMAILQAPRSLPRLIKLPQSCARGDHDFVLLSSLIEQFASELFAGMNATGVYQFRLTRNSDLFVDEEETGDLKRALEGELNARRFGDGVRLELDEQTPDAVTEFLMREFEIGADDVYRVGGPVNLARLMALIDAVDRPDLKFPGFVPRLPQRIAQSDDLFAVIRRGDVLLHHPFDSFAPIIQFIRQAARDPDVLAIRQTVYRTGTDSDVVRALIEAARGGKDVTVVIELRARFDEEANIELAEDLQDAGAHVVYGVVGMKTHAKMLMVVRREGRTLRRYVHLGTGNYHASTARLYTDYGLFTCDRDIGQDVQKIFQQLISLGRAGKLRKLLQSPFTLHSQTLALIEQEARNARAGKPARVMAKMNSLVDPQVIRALYRASMAGVQVDLIVRGICCLRPGLPGVSENIRVRSVVGRFLEHTRIFYYENAGDPLVYLSSADWMPRNFFMRVETCFPVEEPRLRARVIEESFENYLADNTHAWVLQSDGSYKPLRSRGQKRRSAQQALMEERFS